MWPCVFLFLENLVNHGTKSWLKLPKGSQIIWKVKSIIKKPSLNLIGYHRHTIVSGKFISIASMTAWSESHSQSRQLTWALFRQICDQCRRLKLKFSTTITWKWILLFSQQHARTQKLSCRWVYKLGLQIVKVVLHTMLSSSQVNQKGLFVKLPLNSSSSQRNRSVERDGFPYYIEKIFRQLRTQGFPWLQANERESISCTENRLQNAEKTHLAEKGTRSEA